MGLLERNVQGGVGSIAVAPPPWLLPPRRGIFGNDELGIQDKRQRGRRIGVRGCCPAEEVGARSSRDTDR